MSVEDKLDILECLAAYSHTLDNGDDEGWVRLFTEDAVWEAFPKGSETPNIRYEGHDGIRRFAAAMRARSNGSQARHCKVNTIFVELTSDLARIRSNGVITVQAPGGQPALAIAVSSAAAAALALVPGR